MKYLKDLKDYNVPKLGMKMGLLKKRLGDGCGLAGVIVKKKEDI